MEALRQIFPNRVISRNGGIPWPAISPDLSARDFFLWGYLKGKAYTYCPKYVIVLKQEESKNIPTTRKVMADVRDRAEESLRKGGSHLTNTAIKKLTQNLCLKNAFVCTLGMLNGNN